MAIMGFGTVGSGAYDISRNVEGLEVTRILARHGREGYEFLNDIITADIDDITGDSEIELVVESIGGISPAREYVLACLNAGKHVVTPNKNLISAHYDELMQAAEKNDVQLRFTPTAGGGIPWLFNLQRTARCDAINEIHGIVNGTCNYILDAMSKSGADFGVMLKNAQELGYAEADPSADIEGTDTLRKTVISASLAFGGTVSEEDVLCYGIDTINSDDIAYLKKQGYAVRLLMNAKRLGDGKISAYVEPTAIPLASLEANVGENNNLITLTAEGIGTQSFYGQGAGKLPTGESVIQDVIDIRDGISVSSAAGGVKLAVDNASEIHRYYIRHDRMCEHISPLIDTYEEKDGVFYCISKPVAASRMHEMAHHRKEKGRAMFIAGIKE